MTLRAFANKRDAAEPAIVQALEQCGCLVRRMDKPVDLLVFHRPSARVFLVEVKSGKRAKYTLDQLLFMDAGWPVITLRSVDDAISAVQLWAKREAA